MLFLEAVVTIDEVLREHCTECLRNLEQLIKSRYMRTRQMLIGEFDATSIDTLGDFLADLMRISPGDPRG